MSAAAGPRYVAVMFLRPEDDRRRWLVVDLRPWEDQRPSTDHNRKAGAVVADVMGESRAVRIADALNNQPTVDDDDEQPAPAVLGPATAIERPLVDVAYPAGGRVPDVDPEHQAF
jgi:hypothetical protein